MKHLMFSLIVTASAVVFAQETMTPPTVTGAQIQKVEKRRMTPDERKAHREARIAADGGLLERPVKGKVVRVLVKTDKVPLSDIVKEAANMRRVIRTYVEVVDAAKQSNNATGCLVTLAEMGEAPTLLCAPEDFWSTVNVSKLMVDNPSPEVLKARVVKEMWRAVGYALGAPNPQQQPCLMRPIRNVADLDAEKISVLTPMPMMAVAQTAAKLGFARGGQATYKVACQEGWAPAPTNDVQKALWDQAHTLPTKPIQIKYDPKKDK